MKPQAKVAMGIATGLTVMGFIVSWDLFIKDSISSTDVVVVKPGVKVEANERLTRDKLLVEPRLKRDLVDGVIPGAKLDEIIGVEAGQVLYGNSMVAEDMLDRDNMVPDSTEGEAIRPITREMIMAAPGSLRRKDLVDLYIVTKEQQQVMESQEAKSTETEATADTATATSLAKKQPPLLKDVRVVYVRDSSNKEVVTTGGGTDAAQQQNAQGTDEERLNSSAQVSDIEVLLNEEEFSKLQDAVINKGGKLYITYK